MSKKNRPDWRVQSRAMADRRSVLAVIVFSQSGLVSSGSGFVIKRDEEAMQSIVLTSCHFLKQMEADDMLCVRTRIPGGVQELQATVIYKNAPMDVAILRVPGLMSVPPLHFAPNSFAGQNIIAVGYCDPEELFAGMSFTAIPACSPGRVRPEGTLYIKTYRHLRLYHVRLDCVCMSGMSGGPVLSSMGVIGMIDSGMRGLTKAVSPDTIFQVLKKHLGHHPQDNNLSMEAVLDLIT